MKKKLLGISYKNYINTKSEMKPLLEKINEVSCNTDVEIFVCPSIGLLESTADQIMDSNVSLCAQNIGPLKNGALTGELSIDSLIDVNGKFAELGHYERMTIFHEDEAMIKDKIDLCFANNIIPLLCIGDKEKLNTLDRKKFFRETIFNYFNEKRETEQIVIAYEPWWAIGKTESADPKYVHESHEIIYDILTEYFNLENVRIIYGGSVSQLNAKALLESDYVDGLFVGRFGHNVDDFIRILEIVEGE